MKTCLLTILAAFVLFQAYSVAQIPIAKEPRIRVANTAEYKKADFVNYAFLSKFADNLEKRMKGKSVGYSFTIMADGVFPVTRVAGDARRAPDKNPRKMAENDRYNVASVSKTITAAAVMKLLAAKNINIDGPIHKYVPKHWVILPEAQAITFRQLLTHTSGIRCESEVTYSEMRKCLVQGPIVADKKTQKYNNINSALFRVIIPKLNGFIDDKSITDATGAIVFAGLYADYVNNNIFKPLSIMNVSQKPDEVNGGLAYQFPSPVQAGDSMGDMTLTGASRGWILSSRELATFMNALMYSDKIVPRSVAQRMRDDRLGLFAHFEGQSLINYEHGGHFPGKRSDGTQWNKGEINTAIMNFPNGVSLGVIVNSQFGPGESIADTVRAVMKEMTN